LENSIQDYKILLKETPGGDEERKRALLEAQTQIEKHDPERT